MVATPALFFEYEDVLSRSQQVRAHGFTPAEIAAFIEGLARFTVLVPRVHFQVRPQLIDPGDEMVLEAAVNGHAESIVTFNLFHFLPAANAFGIRVAAPGSILKERFSL
jgi:predicted nucleic acid-binding protein